MSRIVEIEGVIYNLDLYRRIRKYDNISEADARTMSNCYKIIMDDDEINFYPDRRIYVVPKHYYYESKRLRDEAYEKIRKALDL